MNHLHAMPPRTSARLKEKIENRPPARHMYRNIAEEPRRVHIKRRNGRDKQYKGMAICELC